MENAAKILVDRRATNGRNKKTESGSKKTGAGFKKKRVPGAGAGFKSKVGKFDGGMLKISNYEMKKMSKR